MSEISAAVIKKTQDSLGKVVKKPVLTDKLLRKPPFKFLHDVIHAVIKNTGYLGSLYTDEELQSDNIKDRDAKISFLQKTIDVVKLSTKQNIKARPSKIVAGLEADKTNELLQAIGKAIEQKIDSSEAVAAVASGQVPETEAKSVKAPTKSETQKLTKSTKQVVVAKKVKKEPNPDAKRKKKPENDAKLTKQHRKGSVDEKKPKSKSSSQQKENTEINKGKSAKNGAAKKPVEEQTLETHSETRIETSNMEEKAENVEKPDEVTDSENIQPTLSEPLNLPATKSTYPKNETENSLDAQNHPLSEVNEKSTNLDKKDANVDEIPTYQKDVNEKPHSSEQITSEMDKPTKQMVSNQVEKPIAKAVDKKLEKLKEKQIVAQTNVDNVKVTRPGTALRSAALRPVSARPSAPRRRDRNVKQILQTENFVQESVDQNKNEKKVFMAEFDDADNIIITDTIHDNIQEKIDLGAEMNKEQNADGKQGHLVQQILETQTAILKADAKNDANATDTVSDEHSINERKSLTQNMTELRKSVQKLSLYITPLGKMMEYFQEDVDAMQIELLMWQSAYAAAEADIKKEQKQTEELLEQFQYQLAEINNNIKEHMEQINNTKTNIIQNEEKISKLITIL